jgi:hypothetical protein
MAVQAAKLQGADRVIAAKLESWTLAVFIQTHLVRNVLVMIFAFGDANS